MGGRVGPPARPEGRADDGDPCLRDRPGHRRRAAGHAGGPSRTPYSWGLPDGRIAWQTHEETRTRLLDPRRDQSVRSGSIVGVDDTGTRLITSRGATNGAEASYLQVRDAQWRPVGTVERVDGYVAEAVFLPGGREIAIAREEVVEIHDARTLAFSRTVEGHSGKVLGIELAGPALGLLWTAGRDGTAVAFDLTGTRGVLRRVDLDVAADVGSAAGNRAALTQRYEIEPNTARILDLDEGRDLFGELQPFTDCVCQIGHTAITPDGRLAVGGVFEWTDDYEEAITDRGRVVVWDTDTGDRRAPSTQPGNPDGLAVTPDGARVLVNGAEDGPSTTSRQAMRSGATRATFRAAGSTASRCRAPRPTGPGSSCSRRP